MKNIAIVEDDKESADILKESLERYRNANGEEFKVLWFKDAISFLTNYKANYDIVFMDIEMPDLNGMDAAKKMRTLDETAVLIFVANMAQYAVNGYEVNAYDFIVKPFSYSNFAMKLQRALKFIDSKGGSKIYIPVDDGAMCLTSAEIIYAEIIKHKIIYHTTRGEYNSHGTLKKAESLINDPYFVKCNSCYLVNLRFVTAVVDHEVFLGNISLQMSHPKRKDFLSALNNYFGGGV